MATTATARWLPRARPAMTRDSTACVPVSLAVEVIDTSGRVLSEIGRLPLPAGCDERAVARSRIGRVLYLDPLVPPQAPAPRGQVSDRGWPPVYAPDPLDGAIVWRDRSDNEDGFRVYARRSWFEADCSVRQRPLEARRGAARGHGALPAAARSRRALHRRARHRGSAGLT